MLAILRWGKVCAVIIFLIYGMAWGQEKAVKINTSHNETSAGTTIIMVRHAEKEKGEDPPLSEQGKFRAVHLKNALKASNVSAIYCPDLKRNRQTAQPLADLFNIPLPTCCRIQFEQTLFIKSFHELFGEERISICLAVNDFSKGK